MVNKNRVILGMVGVLVLGSGIFCGNVLAENPQESEFSVTITPSATLTVPSAPINLIVEPTAEGQFASGSFNITAYTNNPDGFTVTMATSSTALVSNTTNVTTGDPYTIPTLADSTSQANFTPNRWGISLDGGTSYIPMPSSDTIINEDAETGASGYTQAIGYATKLDFGTTPGTYSTTINFTATAKVDTAPAGVEGGSINTDGGGSAGQVFPRNSLLRAFELAYVNAGKPIYIEDANATNGWRPMIKNESTANKQVRFAMQDISMTFTEGNYTHNVCDWADPSHHVGNYIDEALVMDIRDGKSYWILKAEDGKCWMSQNLDLDLVHTANDADALYTHDNTDLGWSDLCQNNDSMVDFCYTPNVNAKWNPSSATSSTTIDVSYSAPKSYDPGDVYVVTSGDDSYDSIYTSLADCVENASTHTADECYHYHSGNYYNWPAAIATNSSANYNNEGLIQAPDSICPAGWRLPMAVYGSWEDDGQLTQFNAEGWEFSELLYSTGIVDANSGTPNYTQDGFTYIRYVPLYFTRSGLTYEWGTNEEVSIQGNYWSSTAGPYQTGDVVSDAMNIYDSYVLPESVQNSRASGYSVRCIAR